MIIDKNKEGAWRISETINGYLKTKVYYFYTKKDAIKLFRKYRREIKNGIISDME
jgi:hypothetical protein